MSEVTIVCVNVATGVPEKTLTCLEKRSRFRRDGKRLNGLASLSIVPTDFVNSKV